MLPREVDGKRFLRAMTRFGWKVARSKGSHRVLRKEGDERMVLVAFHTTLSRNSVRNALKDAGIDEGEFESEF